MDYRISEVALTVSGILNHYLLQIVQLLPRLGAAIALFLLFWFVAGHAGRWLARLVAQTGADSHIVGLFERTARYGLIVLGVVTSLGTLGVDLTAVVATAGLVGFAVSFAFQDIIGNFLAGLLIMLQRPFRLGDVVSVAGIEGIVEDIRVRDTVVRTRDGLISVVPNRNILNNTITNYTANPLRLLEVEMAVSSVEDVATARQVVQELVVGMEAIVNEPAPEVLATKVSPNAITIVLRAWVDTRVRSYHEARSEVLEVLHRRFPEAGITLR